MAAPSLHRLFSLWLIVFPFKCALFAVIFAGPLALAEETTFAKAFLYLVQVLTGASIPLTPWAPSGKALGIAIANSMGIIKQLILALHIGLTAGPMIEPVLDWEVGLWRCCVDGKLFVGRTNAGIYRKTAISWLNTSLFCVVLSFAAGGILAVAEGWPYWNGVVLVLGEVTSSATVLPNQSKLGPDTTGGIIVGFIVGVLAAAILGIIIAVASVPLLGFDLKFDNTHAVRSKPTMLLTKEQQRRLGIELGASEKGTVKSGWMPDTGDKNGTKMAMAGWKFWGVCLEESLDTWPNRAPDSTSDRA